MLSVDKFSQLVAGIYETGLHPDRWNSVLSDICQAIGARAAGLMMTEPKGESRFAVSIGSDPARTESYRQYYGRMDPFVPIALRMPKGSVVTQEMIVERNTMRRSEFYNDWLRLHHVDDGLVAMVADGAQPSALVFAAPTDKNFDTEAICLVRRLVPHVISALHTQRSLGGMAVQRDTVFDLLGELRRAVFFLDAAGAIIVANKTAERLLLDKRDLTSQNRQLQPTQFSKVGEFRRLIAKAVGAGGAPAVAGTMVLERGCGNEPLAIRALPLTPLAIEPLPSARAAVIVAMARSRTPPDLRQAYGLTPAEARVAGLIAAGHGVIQAARELNISPSTVRTHLLRIFAKTGTGRQAELAHLLSGLMT